MREKTKNELLKIVLFKIQSENDLHSFEINFGLIKEWLKKHSKEKLMDFENFPRGFIASGHTIEQAFGELVKTRKDIFGKETFFYNSLFLTLFSILENNLNSLCAAAKYLIKSRLEIQDLKERGIRRSWKYLNILLDVDLSDSKEWDQALIYNGMRNYVSHSRSEVKSEERNIIKYLEKHKMMLDFDEETKHIKFTEKMIEETLETVEKLLEWSYEQVVNKYSIIAQGEK